MYTHMDIDAVLQKNFILDLIHSTCGEAVEIITRPACFMVRSREEGDHDMERLIILPPRGYTADTIEQMNSHDEADYATIEIKGAVRADKFGFSVLKNCLLEASIPENGCVSNLNKPYMTFKIDGDDNPDLTLKKRSAGEAPFVVVKNDGYGFYHNLINLTDDWLVLLLYKRLRPQKHVDLAPHLSGLLTGQAQMLQKLYDTVVEHGDALFKVAPNLVENIMRMPVEQIFPALAEMLFIHDSGKHEACSIFAVILKIGKMHPERVTGFVKEAIERQALPAYYGRQLVEKIARAQATPLQAVGT